MWQICKISHQLIIFSDFFYLPQDGKYGPQDDFDFQNVKKVFCIANANIHLCWNNHEKFWEIASGNDFQVFILI